LAQAVEADRAAHAAPEPARIVLSPKPVDDAGFTIEPFDDGFVVRGEKPERWVRQTDFANDEAVGYLADRLARLGVELRLTELGAAPGDAVTIGDVTFDFEPSGGIDDTAYRPSRRGTDARMEADTRIRAADRLAAKKARRAPTDAPESDE
jgi:GTP-binding protein